MTFDKRPRDARSSGTALVASPAEDRVQAVFTGSQDTARPFAKVPQRPVDPCCCRTRKSGHQAAITSLCHKR